MQGGAHSPGGFEARAWRPSHLNLRKPSPEPPGTRHSKSVSTHARAGFRLVGGAVMSGVILGSGAVDWAA